VLSVVSHSEVKQKAVPLWPGCASQFQSAGAGETHRRVCVCNGSSSISTHPSWHGCVVHLPLSEEKKKKESLGTEKGDRPVRRRWVVASFPAFRRPAGVCACLGVHAWHGNGSSRSLSCTHHAMRLCPKRHLSVRSRWVHGLCASTVWWPARRPRGKVTVPSSTTVHRTLDVRRRTRPQPGQNQNQNACAFVCGHATLLVQLLRRVCVCPC